MQLSKDGVKNIIEFVRAAKSPYVKTFESWAVQITDGLTQANSNLKFLTVLKEPCTTLNTLTPDQFGTVLPGITDVIRLIQLHSEFYTGREAITGLYVCVFAVSVFHGTLWLAEDCMCRGTLAVFTDTCWPCIPVF